MATMANLTNITIQIKLNELSNIAIPTCCSYYRQTPPVSRFHNMNRFGSSANFSYLFSPDPQLKYSYVRGTVVMPIILGIIFAIWTLATLIVLPCLGHKRVGFWSGAGFTTTKNHSAHNNNNTANNSNNNRNNNNNDTTNNTKRYWYKCTNIFKGSPRRVTYARIACFVSLLIQFIFIIPLVTLGFHQLNNTTDTIISATRDTDELLNLYSSAFQGLYNVTASLLNAYQAVLTGISTECSISTPNVDNNLVEKTENKFRTANETLQQVNSTNTAVQSAAITIKTYFVYINFYWIPLLILTILMAVLLVLVWRWEGRRLVKKLRFAYIIIGLLFSVWTMLSWILLLCFLAGLAVNADGCSGDGTSNIPIDPLAPLGTMIAVLYTMNPASSQSNALAELMLYYFGCLDAVPSFFLEFKDNYEAIIIAGLNLLDFVRSNANATAVASLSYENWNKTTLSMLNTTFTTGADFICNEDGVRNLGLLAVAILSALLYISIYVATLSPLLTCIYVSPIYNKMVNEALCTYNPYAMAWILGCLLLLSVCGLTVISLRSAFIPVKVLEEAGVSCSPAVQEDVSPVKVLEEAGVPCSPAVQEDVFQEGAPKQNFEGAEPTADSEVISEPIKLFMDE